MSAALVIAGCGASPDLDAAAPPAEPAVQQVAVGPVETAAPPARPLRGEAARAARAPILMYHVIAEAKPGEAYPELWVPPGRFAAQMRALADAGYEAVTLRELEAGWRDGAPLPRRPVVLTFDDGYLSQSTVARPVLERLGWAGVLYLTERNVGSTIPEASVKRMLRAGWELGAHTATHPDVRTLDAAGLQREIGDVRRTLQDRFGQDVTSFCYPAGRYDDAAVAAVREAGFTSATTVAPGWADAETDPYLLPRVRVDPGDTPEGLLRKIGSARS